MKAKNKPGLIPDAAMLDKMEHIAASLDRKGFIEKTLRETSSSFGRTLDQAAEDVSSLRMATGKAAGKIAVGETANMHDVMAAVDKARNSFGQLVEIRNKMIEACREILRKRT